MDNKLSKLAKGKIMFDIKRYSEEIPAIYGFFCHLNDQLPKNHCDSIIDWEGEVDKAEFTEKIHADMFTGNPNWKPERCRTTLLAVLGDMELCLYNMFPDCKSTLRINWNILRAMQNVDMEFAPLPVNDKPVWFLQRREYYNYQGEERVRWVRITKKEMLEAIAAGDIILGEVVRNAAHTIFSKNWKDCNPSCGNWTAFEINSQKVLKANSKMISDLRWELFYAKTPSRLMSIEWTDEVSMSGGPCDLHLLCDNFNVDLSLMPSPDTDPQGKPIDIRKANWKNKVRLDWRTYYPLYLKSAEWYLVRQCFFMVSGGRSCANIGCDTKATQIHHLSYMTVGCEKFKHLIPLCQRCHAYFHQCVNLLEKSDIEEIQRQHENREVSPESQPLQTRLW